MWEKKELKKKGKKETVHKSFSFAEAYIFLKQQIKFRKKLHVIIMILKPRKRKKYLNLIKENPFEILIKKFNLFNLHNKKKN